MKKKVVLIIRDGMGIAPPGKFNAVYNADTPVNDRLLADYPHTTLAPSGSAVGLPDGYQGSSEVGHLNIGAGRIVKQEITRINESMEDGSFFKSESYTRAIKNVLDNNSALHIMGLVQNEGVHAHQDHLFAIIKHAVSEGVTNIKIHFFSDGRDTPPRSSLTFLRELEQKIAEYGAGQICTLMGRYYSMDRGRNWNLTDMAYETLVSAKGDKFRSAREAIEHGYESLKSPDGSDMTDEYIPPAIIGDYDGIHDGDSVIHFNYRQDRAIQLTKAFVEDEYEGKRSVRKNIVYAGLTKYYDSFAFNVLGAMNQGGGLKNILPEVLSKNGLKQLRAAETQKFSHVTSFINGKRIEPFAGEERIEVKTGFDPSTFADHPEMKAREVAQIVEAKIRSGEFDFVLVNFANCDMVGHTGNYESALKAVEIVDESVGKLLNASLETGADVLITADHGNAEEMFNPSAGEPKTSHTINPVYLSLASPDSGDAENIKLRGEGVLADIAPTVLDLLGIEKPVEMTAQSLIESKEGK